MKVFNARESRIRLICNECYEKRPPKELIEEFLEKIRHIPVFWALDNEVLREVYETIDEIRDYYQNEIGDKKCVESTQT